MNSSLEDFQHRIFDYVTNQCEQIKGQKSFLATSDVIESLLGKYKQFSGRCPFKEMGQMLLTICLSTMNLTTAVVKNALETISFADVEQWFAEVFGQSMLYFQSILTTQKLHELLFFKRAQSQQPSLPPSKITGGKIKSSQTRKVVNRAANAFRLAAQSLSRSNSALGGFYRRMRSPLGAPKAITATAHKLARMFDRLWTTREAYSDPGDDYYEQQYRERMVQ